MAPADVSAFFRSAIEANWTYTRIKWPNEQSFNPNGQPYLEVEFPYDTEQLASFGSPGASYLSHEGAAVIRLYLPIGAGLNDPSAPWQTRGDSLIAALRPKQFANGLGETYEAMSDECYEEGSYFVRSIAIAYHYQKFG